MASQCGQIDVPSSTALWQAVHFTARQYRISSRGRVNLESLSSSP